MPGQKPPHRMIDTKGTYSWWMADRQQLRATFDSSAAGYHRARPRYPTELFDAVEGFARTGPSSDVLEIGCATGIATIPMAQRGYRVTGIELGPELAAHASENTYDHSDVSIVSASYDSWEPPNWGAFDLIIAATSWHWLDPATKYQRAHRHLRPHGTLAFWSALHVVPDSGDMFFADIQDVYDEIGESLPGHHVFPKPGQLPDETHQITATGLFDHVCVQHFDWEITYNAESYVALLNTFSGHISMEEWKRVRLYDEIRRRLAQRPDGRLRRHWGAALHLTRRAS